MDRLRRGELSADDFTAEVRGLMAGEIEGVAASGAIKDMLGELKNLAADGLVSRGQYEAVAEVGRERMFALYQVESRGGGEELERSVKEAMRHGGPGFAAAKESEPKRPGVGGWLALVTAVVGIAFPVCFLVMLGRRASLLLALTQEFTHYTELLRVTQAELLAAFVFLAGSVASAVLLLMARPRGLRMAQVFLGVMALFHMLEPLYIAHLPLPQDFIALWMAEMRATWITFSAAPLGCLLYLLFSPRVKKTFFAPGRYKRPRYS